jgi:hypothetical protein
LKDHLLEKNLDFTCLDEEIDHCMLRNLDETKDGRFRVLVATDKAISMRGLDYRAPLNGIHLLVCKSFSHEREA